MCLHPHIGDACFPQEKDSRYIRVHFTLLVYGRWLSIIGLDPVVELIENRKASRSKTNSNNVVEFSSILRGKR